MKKIISYVLSIVICLSILSGCGGDSFVGKWYSEKGRCLDIRSDGTYDLEEEYGTGTWKKLDDGNYEFTDFYGDNDSTEIETDDFGTYVKYGRGGIKFYKDAYPEEAKEADNDSANNDIKKASATTEESKKAIKINPFKGLKIEISGISPFCQLAFNTQNCDESVEELVTFQADKQYYANGETASVLAVLNDGGELSTLSETEKEYEISGQPECISSVENIDLSVIKQELNDFVTADIAQAKKYGTAGYANVSVLGVGTDFELKDVTNLQGGQVYLLSAKKNKLHDVEYVNMIAFTYSADCKGEFGEGHIYSCVRAVNVVQYPDGSIKWGSTSTDDFDFLCEGTRSGMEDAVTTCIMTYSADYNISKVEV